MHCLLPLLDGEIDKLGNIEEGLRSILEESSPPDRDSVSVDLNENESGSHSEFDITWRPDDHDSPELMKRLLIINRTTPYQELLRASRLGHTKTMEELVSTMHWEQLASATDDDGRTALEIATSAGHEDIVEMILSKRSDSSRAPVEPPEYIRPSTDAPGHRVEFAPDVESPESASSYDSGSSSTSLTILSDLSSLFGQTAAHHVDSRPDISTCLSQLNEAIEFLARHLMSFRNTAQSGLQQEVVEIDEALENLNRLRNILRQLSNACMMQEYEYSLHRIVADLQLVQRSVELTYKTTYGMVAHAREERMWMIWGDLDHRLRYEQQASLSTRLRWYFYVTQGLLAHIEGFPLGGPHTRVRDKLNRLFELQYRVDRGWAQPRITSGESQHQLPRDWNQP